MSLQIKVGTHVIIMKSQVDLAFTNQGLYKCYYNEDSGGPVPSQIKVCTHVIIMKMQVDL